MKEVLTWNTACAVIAVAAFALNLWVFMRRRRERRERLSLEEPNSYRERWTECVAFQAFWQLHRAKLLAGGYGKHHAYHVTDDGVLLAVDAVDYYLAVLAGANEFWDAVATAGGERGNPFAVTLDEIDLGDGKGDFTYVYNRCGEAFVDAVLPFPLPYSDDSARATADDFKDAVIDAQAEAAKRKRIRYAKSFHDGHHTTTA